MGLKVNDVSFAVSPPYFECASGNEKERILTLVTEFTVEGHVLRGENFQLQYFCFALLCYHFEFLGTILHRRNKLLASIFFTHIPNYAKEAVMVRYPWNKTDSTPSFTGIPPHVGILAQHEGLKLELKMMAESMS